MPVGAKGWVQDDIGDVYWIMAVLWKSRGLFSRGTVCYRVRSKHGIDYALKDCWVDEDCLEHEVTFLEAVRGIPNVVQLVKHWDVKFNGEIDSTSKIRAHIRDHLPKSCTYVNKIHRRMLLTPCGLPLTTFKSVPELLNVFQDVVVAHETMVSNRKVLHGDLSPNNLIIHEGKGYFIDFDHAKFLTNNKALESRGTGTIPYMSCRLLKLIGDFPSSTTIEHKASDDLESLFYIFLEFTLLYEGPGGKITDQGIYPINASRWRKAYIAMDRDGLGTSGSLKKEFITDHDPSYQPAPYFQDCRPVLEEWRRAIASSIAKDKDVSHGEIREIIKRGIENLPVPKAPSSITARPASSSVASSSFLPPAPSPTTQESSFQPRRSLRKNIMVSPNVPPPLASSSTAQEPLPDSRRRSSRNKRSRM
ncbi:kinase-like domain-containing protein [Suillus americanus]|nr:kinase-like domain-containing protein [Suillus americanus]